MDVGEEEEGNRIGCGVTVERAALLVVEEEGGTDLVE